MGEASRDESGDCEVILPLPPPDGMGGQPTVVGVVYGHVSQGTTPLPGLRFRAFAFKDQCRDTNSDTALGTVDSVGNYRHLFELVGTPGQGCVLVRFYYDRQGAADSVVIKDVFLNMKASGKGVVPDSVRIDAVIP